MFSQTDIGCTDNTNLLAVTWLCDTDTDLGDDDDEYEDADDPDDLTTDLSEGEAILDCFSDLSYSVDDNGCVDSCQDTVLCYADTSCTPPKTKKHRTIRLRRIHINVPPKRKRVKKVYPKPIHNTGGGSG